MNLAFPKPKDVKKKPVAVRVFRDGRECCNLLCKEGRDEYTRRLRNVWEKQTWVSKGINQPGHFCSLCNKELYWKDATVDHIRVRGMGGGSRDDREQNIAAAHGLCNAKRGSQQHGFYGVP